MADRNPGFPPGAAPPGERAARGRTAEDLAARYLAAAGLEILERNVRLPGGELDLVAREGDLIVFVEVRSRRRGSRFSPEATVDRGKRARLARAADAWLSRRGLPLARCRFDVVAVVAAAGGYRLRHRRGAFVDG
ncbi:MAG: YraN family protein [Acidobacteria bacterium]|jgi:putative endonuclease|nr:YraN family protein [Acidobacteriota bacterium]MCU0253692.1 YraN family protein [Acidobacteriota bacterium]